MDLIRKAESALAGVFKSAPNISASGKESLAKAWPWLAVIFGVLQLWAAWVLWDLLRVADRVTTIFGTYINSGFSVYSGKDKFFIYLSIISLVVDAVLLLVAYPKLVKRQKAGWDLIFIAALINAVYGVLNLFIYGRGFGSLIASLAGSVVGFYLLFQVREKYNHAAKK